MSLIERYKEASMLIFLAFMIIERHLTREMLRDSKIDPNYCGMLSIATTIANWLWMIFVIIDLIMKLTK